jgi:hypothetical protein
MGQLHFSQDDAQQFAAWSGDHNPLHVDLDAARRSVFGQPVIHGILTTIRALGAGLLDQHVPLRHLDVEFRSAVHSGVSCALEHVASDAGAALTLRTGDAPAMTLRVNGNVNGAAADVSWLGHARANRATLPPVRHQPANLEPEALLAGRELVGSYTVGGAVPREYLAGGLLHPVQARVLGLCSYVIGMEIPGLRSLFTRLSVELRREPRRQRRTCCIARVRRSSTRTSASSTSRLDVVTPDGVAVASGELRSYVRFSPVVTDPAALAASLADAEQPAGRVALVCGGSRGLGAEITTALAVSGCHVYAGYRRDAEAAREIWRVDLRPPAAGRAARRGRGGSRQWCEMARAGHPGASRPARHPRAQRLRTARCALRLERRIRRPGTHYVAANLPLAQVPLATCLPALAASAGTSSSASRPRSSRSAGGVRPLRRA